MKIQYLGNQIKVNIPVINEETRPLTFTVNGASIVVPRGEDVILPAMYAGVIEQYWKARFHDTSKLQKENEQGVFVIDSEHYTYGDDALQAILEGKHVLVKVPNKDGKTLYSNFMPVLQYQLPDENNDYLTLFYLKDGIAENIMAAMATQSFDGVFGEITMKLSKMYAECPLK